MVNGGLLNQPGSVGRLMYRGTQGPSAGPKGFITEAEQLAYQAPFPDESYMIDLHLLHFLQPPIFLYFSLKKV